MRKIARLTGVLVVVIGIAFMIGCPSPITELEPPSNLTVTADNTGIRVQLRWDASPTADIDGYIVYFRSLGAKGEYVPIDTVAATETEREIDPRGKAGYYRVTAYKGDTESDPSNEVSTVPIHTDPATVYELNASGPSGYGWDRTTGTGATYSMIQASSASSVDFYITNFESGHSGTPWYISSPDASQSSYDSGIVPPASWRQNGILPVTVQVADSVLPERGNYQMYQVLVGDSYYGVHTEDDYYGLVHTLGTYDPQSGSQNIETWFQLVHGLRILNHQ